MGGVEPPSSATATRFLHAYPDVVFRSRPGDGLPKTALIPVLLGRGSRELPTRIRL